MNEKNTKELVRKYPELYRDVGCDPRTTCMAWGFECGDGWNGLLDALSAVITCHEQSERKWRALNRPSFRSRFNDMLFRISVWGQRSRLVHVRNENGSLRPEEPRPTRASQVKEKFGTLRFYTSGHDDYVDGAIAVAEAMSAITCERCGAPGVINEKGWLRCLCPRCREDKAEPDSLKTVRMPYSFFSHEGHGDIIESLNRMGYRVVKTYPEEGRA